MTSALSTSVEKRHYRFDGFVVDPVRRRLVRAGEAVAITPKAFSILLILLERRGEVVDKEELIRRVWPDTFVSEANLTQNLSSLRKALGERANERRYVITVPGRGYSFVAEFVAEVEEVEAALSSGVDIPIPVLPPRPLPAATPTRGGGWLAAAVLVLLLAGVAAALLLARKLPPSMAGGEARPSLAVLSFRNLSGAPASEWLGVAVAEMLTTELATGGRVRVVSGENVARARQSPESLDPASLRRLHRILSCELLVVGSYLPLGLLGPLGPLGNREGARIRLDLRVLQLPSGDTVASLAEVGTEAELFELVARTGAKLRQALGLAELSPEQARVARKLQPASPEAARLYSAGLARLRAFDTPHAVVLLRQAAEADPGSATIRSALAQAWATHGYDGRAREEAARAVELSASLPRPERLAIEARSHQVARQWRKAGEIYRTLWTFFPDDLEIGLQLASSLSEGGRGDEAMAVVGELRRLRPPAGEDPRIDLTEAAAALRLSDPARMLQASRRAAEKGKASGESLIVALALRHEGAALLMQGDVPAAIRLFEQARGLFHEAGDAWGVATALAYVGISLQKQGDLAGAERVYKEALDLIEKLGNVAGLAAQLGNLGILYQSQGDLERALGYLERSHAQFAEIEDPLLESRVLSASASILFAQGDLAGARSRLEEVLVLSRKVGSRNDEARAFVSLAAILVWKGEVREAGRLTQEAYRILRERDASLSATALAAWADTLARQGDLAGARQRLQQALAVKKQTGDRIGAGQILGALASLELRAGSLAAARARNGEQLRIAEESGARPLRIWGGQERGREELAAGDLAAARRSMESALEESSAAGEELRAMVLRTDLARLELAEGDAEQAAQAAGEAAGWWKARGVFWGEAMSLSVLAEALAREGRRDGARAVAARMRVLVERGEDRDLFLAVAPGLARAEAAAGDEAEALRTLGLAIGEAGSRGFAAAGLEARLAAAEIGLERGRPAARSDLEALRRDAAARGFGLLARRAARALTVPRS
jgi:DNA-binding winged helix-turn-helix (wHTH) protein/tetratricopeptide (TPR) repeat protein